MVVIQICKTLFGIFTIKCFWLNWRFGVTAFRFWTWRRSLRIAVGPWVIWIVLLSFKVNINHEFFFSGWLHRHLISQFYPFQSTGWAIAWAKIPCHYFKVRAVENLGDATSVFDTHNLVVWVNMGNIVTIWIRILLHMLCSITLFKVNTVVPIMPIFTHQRVKSIILFELIIAEKVAFHSWVVNWIWGWKILILDFWYFWKYILFNFGKILLMTFNHSYISQFVFQLISIFWYNIKLFDRIILWTLSQIWASSFFVLYHVDGYNCATEFLLFFLLFIF